MDKKFIAHRHEKDWIKKQEELLRLLHDLGKATCEFYRYISSATPALQEDGKFWPK